MESMFKFTVVRPPLAINPRYHPIRLGDSTPFQVALARNALAAPPADIRALMDATATTYLASPEFAAPDIAEKNNVRIDAATTAMDSVAATGLDNTSLGKALATATGAQPTAFIAEVWLQPLLARIKDTILALRQLALEDEVGTMAILAARLRTIETIQKVTADKSFPLDVEDLSQWRLRPILAPTFAELNSELSDANARADFNKKYAADNLVKKSLVGALFKERNDLLAAHVAVASISKDQIFTKPPTAVPAIVPNADFTATAILKQHLTILNQFSNLTLNRLQPGVANRPISNLPHIGNGSGLNPALNPAIINAGTTTSPTSPPPNDVSTGSVGQDATNSTSTSAQVDMTRLLFDQIKSITPQSGRIAFNPPPATEIHFAVKSTALPGLAPVSETLKSKNIDVTSQPIDVTVNQLNRHISDNTTALNAHFANAQPAVTKLSRVGNIKILSKSSLVSPWQQAFLAGDIDSLFPPADSPLGMPSGKVTILGRSDLLVVKQQLVGYSKGDIAYIHNVLKSEKNNREVTTTQSTVTTIMSETETTTDKQTDTTVADRFEMSSESQNTIKEDESLKAGATIAASYGPAVHVNLSASGSTDRSQETSGKTASKFSKDVTTKASDRIMKRVLDRVTTTTTTIHGEKEEHGFDNTSGKTNISGVYQWLNKIYEAQTWCYGKRTMLDFMIPEPGAFLLGKMADITTKNPTDVVVIPPFGISADDITPENYPGYAKDYGVTDIDPPPKLVSRKAASYSGGAEARIIHNEVITIEAGFFVFAIKAQATGSIDQPNSQHDKPWVRVQCGENLHWLWDPDDESAGAGITSVAGACEENEVAFSVAAQSMDQVAVNVELVLIVTAEAMNNWKVQTWAKLRAAHDKLVEAQNDALKEAQFNATVSVSGTNPADNLVVMNNEIKKSCISIMTDQHFEKFGAIVPATKRTDSGAIIWETNISKAWSEGPYVRFFEEAFEWEEATWITYPYFWGRKNTWYSKMEYSDSDPLFEKFIKAGYARANVPVREGWEGALDHFMHTGRVWMGGPLPGISSPLFLPLAAEIQESLGKASEDPVEYPGGGPWTVVVPTSLVKLRKDDDTPTWTKVNGVWTENVDVAPSG